MSSLLFSRKLPDRKHILWLCQGRVGYRFAPKDLESVRITDEALAERVASIVLRNLASGRAGRAMVGRYTSDLQEPVLQAYVDRVINCYLQEHHRVERLAAKEGAEWDRLYGQLVQRASHALQDYRVSPARAADEAQDFAQETCETIFCRRFPYDVPFDGWVTRILLNRIHYRRTRSKGMMSFQLSLGSLDQAASHGSEGGFSMHEFHTDGEDVSAFERLEQHMWLLQVVRRLNSQDQQQVIMDKYFAELKDDEIARRMGKTRQAVWNLRRRALRNLRTMLA